MTERIADWYAEKGKPILLNIAIVFCYICLVCSILAGIIWCIIFGKDGMFGIGIAIFSSGIVNAFICILLIGFLKGEIELFYTIKSSSRVAAKIAVNTLKSSEPRPVAKTVSNQSILKTTPTTKPASSGSWICKHCGYKNAACFSECQNCYEKK